MSLWRQVTRGVRILTNRAATDRDIADEVQHYLDEAIAAHMERGLSREQAERAARREVGNPASVRQQVHDYGWENIVETSLADLRYAVRRLRSEPGFTAITSLTLALGVGGTTAIFSAVNPILFKSLPYLAAERITVISETLKDGTSSAGTFGMYRELADRARSFTAVAVFMPWRPTMKGADQPERFEGQRVSASYFDVLGVAPVIGRTFLATEDVMNGPNAVVVSDALWRRRLGADPSIVGRQVTLDEVSFTVVGIMPRGFENVLAPSAELWAPLQYDMSQGRAWGHHLGTIGRLQPASTAGGATRELEAIRPAVLDELKPPTYGKNWAFTVTSLQDDITKSVKPALVAVLGGVVLVLLIACVNVTNLLLARGVRRRAEFALRGALGAGQSRLVRQLLAESVLLASFGGALGLVVADIGVRILLALSPPGLPRLNAIGIDGAVLAFGFGVTSVLGLAIGLLPALQASVSQPHGALQLGARPNIGGHRRARGALVVAEIAVALVLLVVSGLLLRSLERLFAVDVGFDASHIMTMQVQTVGGRFNDRSTADRFFQQALEAVKQLPGVSTAALTSQLPMSGDKDAYGVFFDPTPSNDPGEIRGSFRYAVSPGYLGAVRIPLRQGRVFDDRDDAGAPLVALISESMAKRRLPGLDPIGQRLRIGTGPLYTVIGVVGDVRQMSLAVNEPDAVYTTAAQWRFADRAMSLVVRMRDDAPAALAPAIRQAIWSVDKDQPITRVSTMEDLLAASAAERRFALILFEAFALAALVLAAAGIYGVLAAGVAERTREIGVRSALGASRANILGLVLGQGLRLTGLGVLLGLAAAVAASQLIGAMLFGVSRFDPLTYAAVSAMLVIVSVLACALPAWRALLVDPVTTLRAE
jgi:putative ABC transport system permease protein